jgi:sugar phosphate isomerase/epimerase
MNSRRKFLKESSALALAGLMIPRMSGAFSKFSLFENKPIGIQLYSVNKFIGDDPKGLFKKIADIGFKNIETAFSQKGYYYGMKPAELKVVFKDLGLNWLSHHVMGAPFRRPQPTGANPSQQSQGQQPSGPVNIPTFITLAENYQQLVDDAAEGGLQYLVCASTPIGTLDEIKSSIDVFNKTAEACKKAGIQFVYHNHVNEFDQIEGKRPYDLILGQTDKDLVKMELDLAWATKAKQDPLELFKGNPGRFPLWHVKDYDLTNNKITEVGNGSVDFKRIFTGAESAGMKHFFYEQDGAPTLDSVSLSFKNIEKILS